MISIQSKIKQFDSSKYLPNTSTISSFIQTKDVPYLRPHHNNKDDVAYFDLCYVRRYLFVFLWFTDSSFETEIEIAK